LGDGLGHEIDYAQMHELAHVLKRGIGRGHYYRHTRKLLQKHPAQMGHLFIGTRVDIEYQNIGVIEKTDAAPHVQQTPDMGTYFSAVDVCAGRVHSLASRIRTQNRNDIFV
jgi:hypothetical protein